MMNETQVHQKIKKLRKEDLIGRAIEQRELCYYVDKATDFESYKKISRFNKPVSAVINPAE